MAADKPRLGDAATARSGQMAAVSALELFEDQDGSIVVGWVGDGVLYARFRGGISGNVGIAFSQRLSAAIEQVSSLQYFADSSEVTHYDLLARSAMVRVILTSRRKFGTMVMLTWVEGISAAARSIAEVIGEPISILTDKDEFLAQVVRAAPFAHRKLDPKAWVQVPLVLTR